MPGLVGYDLTLVGIPPMHPHTPLTALIGQGSGSGNLVAHTTEREESLEDLDMALTLRGRIQYNYQPRRGLNSGKGKEGILVV